MASDNDSQAGKVIAATVIGLFFASLAVFLRWIARRYQGMRQFTEDWLIYGALASKVGIDIGGIVLICNGLGRHMNTLTPAELVTFAKTQFTGSFFYPLCITLVKLSILFQYRRLFFHHSQSFHYQIIALMVIVGLWGFGIILTAFFLCLPMAKLWNPALPGSCINIVSFYYGLQIPNIVTDLLIIICPVREVLTLDLSKKMRFGAMTMFLLGVITLIFDIVRLVAMVQLESQGPDQTYNLVHPAVWTTIEPTVAIVTVCIPSVRSLYRAKRKTPGNTSASTTNPAISVQEVAKFGSEEDVEIGELPTTRSQEGLRGNAQSIASVEEVEEQQAQEQYLGRNERAAWPPVTMLLESERPFARFEEFDGRQKS